MTGTAFLLVFVLFGSNAIGMIEGYRSLAECEQALAYLKSISKVSACVPAPEK